MADQAEILDALESLAVHCRPPLMSVEDRGRWMADWCNDLAEFPAHAIQTACQRWRMGTNPKFPMAGQFLPLVRSVNARGAVDPEAKAKAWEPATEAEYQAMSLSRKIEEHTLLAMREDRLAGPMWGNGAPIPLEDMPPAYHEHKARAKNHRAEAARLREKLSSYQGAA
jgi:hypothetical protein